jgi:hypothetical protein
VHAHADLADMRAAVLEPREGRRANQLALDHRAQMNHARRRILETLAVHGLASQRQLQRAGNHAWLGPDLGDLGPTFRPLAPSEIYAGQGSSSKVRRKVQHGADAPPPSTETRLFVEDYLLPGL